MLYTSLDAQEKGRAANESFAQKYKKPLIFLASVVVIVSIILLIVFVLLDHTGRPAEGPEKYPFTLDSIFNSSLSPKSFSLQWDKSGQSYLYQDPITRHWYRKTIADLNSNTSTLVVNVTELAEAIPNYAGFSFSPDGSALLVAVNETSIWRHSFTAAYLIYTLSTKAVHSLVPGNPQIQNVVWNPANSMVSYVFENNIYIVDTTNYAITTVTADGNEDGILNGVQSWVYEEEIFSDSKALWWSTDGSKLAYLRFDESEVPIFEYTLYNGNPYPTEVPLRYPKAGYTNPSVSLYVWDTAINNQSAFPAVEFGADETWEYIASVQWDANNVLWTQQLNRYQNHSAIVSYTYNAGTWTADTVFTQFSTKWIEINPIFFCGGYNLAILPSGDHFHIATLGTNNQAPAFQTSGNFDVISYAGCTKEGKILYLATPTFDIDRTKPVAATLQQIYELDLTTDVSVQVGNGVGVYTATSFSPLGDYFVMRYLGPNVPQVFLVSTDFATNVTLQDNKIYAEIITHYDFPTKKYTTVKGEAGDTLNAFYKEPVGTDDDSHRPLIINVYAGPGTQKVQQTHEVAGLDAWLALQGYVVASIDGRGTGRRGLAFLQATYKQLGLLEIADQRAGAKDLADKLGFVDSGRVAIWGWSFGGFMAAHGIAGTSGIDGFDFKASVSVAPVSDWRYYDSVYTERYMSTPQDNPSGYNATSVLQYAGNTPANKLLLMHGTGDDNVHFQNTVELVNVLITSNVQFETMFYPNDDHSINSGNARKYLYEKMTHFLEQEL